MRLLQGIYLLSPTSIFKILNINITVILYYIILIQLLY